MNAETCTQVGDLVLRRLGLRVSGSVADGEMQVVPSDHEQTEAFMIRFRPDWRSAEALLVPGSFAGAMVRSMGESDSQAKALFSAYNQSLVNASVRTVMHVNDSLADPAKPESWPKEWKSFRIALTKKALVFDLNKDTELLPVADMLVIPLVGMVMSLVGTEALGANEGELEGTPIHYMATRHERKKINRDACIRIHGLSCKGCGFNFGEFYGSLAEGYIEVHHIETLAGRGEVLINPAADLVPLCANCHAAVHQVAPPLSIEELQKRIEARKV